MAQITPVIREACGFILGVRHGRWAHPLLDEILTEVGPTRYPTLMSAGAAGAFDQADRASDDATPYLEREARDGFSFALARFLDGLEAYVDALPPQTPS